MSGHKITVVLATYNRASILPMCLKSIATQTYQKWKLVIVNDASTDQTEEVIKQYLNDNRVHYLKNFGNQGMIKSRNLGIDHCKTELAFIAEDDVVLHEDCLEILVKRYNELKINGIKNVFCVAPKIISSAQSKDPSRNGRSWFKLNKFTGWIYTHYGDEFTETPILPSVGLYNSELLKKIKHDESYGRNILRSDDDLHLTARKLGLKLFYEPKAIAVHLCYRSGGNRGYGSSEFVRMSYYIWRWRNHIRFNSKFFGMKSIYMNLIFSLVYLIHGCLLVPLPGIQSFRRAFKEIFKKLSPIILRDLE
jgi:glycosyltransferase involved in cell wall biosynthesis